MHTNLDDFPKRRKLTTPSFRAKSVSSLPTPTLTPGENRVPRCRTRMLPAVTFSPPNRFTPRRCALLSRPFRELPPPFLCAIPKRSSADSGDLYFGILLPVTAADAIALASLFLEHDHRIVLHMPENLRLDGRALDEGGADLHAIVIGDEQDTVERHDAPDLLLETRYKDAFRWAYFELLFRYVDDRKHDEMRLICRIFMGFERDNLPKIWLKVNALLEYCLSFATFSFRGAKAPRLPMPRIW